MSVTFLNAYVPSPFLNVYNLSLVCWSASHRPKRHRWFIFSRTREPQNPDALASWATLHQQNMIIVTMIDTLKTLNTKICLVDIKKPYSKHQPKNTLLHNSEGLKTWLDTWELRQSWILITGAIVAVGRTHLKCLLIALLILRSQCCRQSDANCSFQCNIISVHEISSMPLELSLPWILW